MSDGLSRCSLSSFLFSIFVCKYTIYYSHSNNFTSYFWETTEKTRLLVIYSYLALFFLKLCNPFSQILLKQGFVGKTECILLCIICLIRSIVPQELVYIKTYPFGMIKLIQQIYGIYLNPHTGFYWWTQILGRSLELMRQRHSKSISFRKVRRRRTFSLMSFFCL